MYIVREQKFWWAYYPMRIFLKRYQIFQQRPIVTYFQHYAIYPGHDLYRGHDLTGMISYPEYPGYRVAINIEYQGIR